MDDEKLLASILDEDYLGEGRFDRHFGDATAWGAVALLDGWRSATSGSGASSTRS